MRLWDPDLLLRAARFTTGYVRLVGQEPAPSKCILMSTFREVQKEMKGWVLSHGDKWSVKFDVRDLGGHLDTTFRGWSSTLAARVRLVISRLVLFPWILPLDSHGRIRVVRSMYLPAALHGMTPPETSVLYPWTVWSRRQPLDGVGAVLSLLDGPLGVTLLIAWFGFGFGCFAGILHFSPRNLVGFTVFQRW